ncbi:MAG: acyl-CoA thioesterase [Clostridia bacterium]|nr:acyl-CoA thioesterase [Clostridia bacterium]
MEIEKKISDSVIDMVELVLPNDVNLLNNLKGGTLMHWIDIAAALTASKHSNHIVATVAMDSLDFKHPIKLGEMVRLVATMVSVGNTSMKIKVEVWAENLQTGSVIMTNEANLVFVALDDNGRPVRVPRLIEG